MASCGSNNISKRVNSDKGKEFVLIKYWVSESSRVLLLKKI